jgi:hypothetical protein
MSEDELSAELRGLFEAERRRAGPPAGAKERVEQALVVSLGVGIGLGAAGGASAASVIGGGSGAAGLAGGGASATGAAGLASGGAAAAAATTAASGATATATGGALAKGLALALVTAMAGTAGTGIWLAQRDERPPQEAPLVAPTTEVPARFDPTRLGERATPGATLDPAPAETLETPRRAPAREARPLPRGEPAAVLRAAPAAPVASEEREAPLEERAAGTIEERSDRLRGERAVLDEARSAVAGGDGSAALIALEAHRRSYADGALVEEREALLVLALAKLGRLDEARAKAERFRAVYPRSLMLPAIDAAVRAD